MEKLVDPSKWRDKVKTILSFRYLSMEELDRILKVASILEYDGDEPIVREGDLEPFFFGILEGTVGVSVKEGRDKEVYMCSLGPGDVFGEAGLFIKVKRTASVTALGKAVLLRLHRQDLAMLIRDKPVAANKMLLVVIYSLLKKLRAANQELAYERRDDFDQVDIDAMVDSLLSP